MAKYEPMAAFPRFQPFGADHIAILFLTLASAVSMILATRRLRTLRKERMVRLLFASGLSVAAISFLTYNYSQGFPVLPFHLCDFALVAVTWALYRPQTRIAVELGYFWALAGSVQAILTPDLIHGFPSYFWFNFFLLHCGVVLGAVYLMSAGHVHLTRDSFWRIFFASHAYMAAAGLVNWILGTNFGYLAGKPSRPSLLDYFGPWPYYLLAIEAIGIVLYFICFALNRWTEHRAK